MNPQVCETCGQVAFPPRSVCSRCGGSRWRETVFARGVVAEATDTAGGRVATVHCDDGTHVIAQLPLDASPGDRVALELRGGAVVAAEDPASTP